MPEHCTGNGFSKAGHSGLGSELQLEVVSDHPGAALQGFQCVVAGPDREYVADDAVRERTMGLIGPTDRPNPKEGSSFLFPRDFPEAPAPVDLRDGEYRVYWTAWEAVEGGVAEYRPLDVARDSFRVLRNGEFM
jgi:hypothetical protein